MKGGLIIDLIGSKKPRGEDDEEMPPEEGEEEMPPAAAKQDPEQLFSSIESQLAELRRAVGCADHGEEEDY